MVSISVFARSSVRGRDGSHFLGSCSKRGTVFGQTELPYEGRKFLCLRGQLFCRSRRLLRVGVAARVEHLRDPHSVLYTSLPGGMYLWTNTLTLEFAPVKHLVFRLDNRFEIASQELFPKGDSSATKTWFSSVVGVVVNSDVLTLVTK